MEPRLIPRSAAAKYCGVSRNTFDDWVKKGLLPSATPLGKRPLWDRKKLDLCLDRLSGLTPEAKQDEVVDRVLQRAKAI